MSLRTRLNIHHPLLTGQRQQLLEVGPNILQNCDKRLPQSPNITFYSFLLFLDTFPFPRAFFLRFNFIRLTSSVLREMLSRYPSSQHSASSDIPCFFTLPPPEFPSFSSTPVVPFSTLFFPLYSSFLFLPLTLFIFHFLVSLFPPNVHDSKDFYNLQYLVSLIISTL